MKLTANPIYISPISLQLLFGLVLLITTLIVGAILTFPRHQEIKLAPGTEGLVKQTATHLSKLSGGVSVGGFPGFEPPSDDKKYREKIKNRQFQPHEINGWVREINNFLQQIVDKNPTMTLAEILKQLGKSPAEIENFINQLKNIYELAEALEHIGVNPETLLRLKNLLNMLGVSL